MAVLMKRQVLAVAALLATFPLMGHAHKVWLLPSQTALPNSGGWITVDAAVSNDLFFYTWYPFKLDSLAVTAPDGSPVMPQNPWEGRYRSTFELELKKAGTHRIAVYAGLLMAHFEVNGEPQRWRGPAAEFSTAIPASASKLEVAFDEFRVETFVTVGGPGALKSTGRGLELVPITHPNDLVAGETASFRFLLDGKPAREVEVVIVAGNTRYRDTQDELKLKTNDEGVMSVRWPSAGMYWLEAATQDEKSPVPQARTRYLTYIGTFEVQNP